VETLLTAAPNYSAGDTSLKYSFNYFMEEKYDFVIKMSHIKGCEDLIN
jgi:hypothetical protein